jgi:bifunctional DNase/RNase
MRRSAILAAALLTGCGAAPAAPTTVVVAAPPISTARAADPEPARPTEPEPPRPPKDYVEMIPLRVEPTPNGAALLLGDEAGSVIVPVFIGGTEAMSIQLRLEKQRHERPLTHDLFDAAVHELGAELWKVQVDALHHTTFIGRVFLRKGDRIIDLDARPSDAIALALGNRVPIYVAQRVIDSAGVRRDDARGDAEPAPDGATAPRPKPPPPRKP